MTQEGINHVLQNKINEVVLSNLFDYAYIIPTGYGDFNIFLPAKFSLEERSQGLIHEICHAHYAARGFDLFGRGSLLKQEDGKKMDELIEKEAQRFYGENKEFINSIAANYAFENSV